MCSATATDQAAGLAAGSRRYVTSRLIMPDSTRRPGVWIVTTAGDGLTVGRIEPFTHEIHSTSAATELRLELQPDGRMTVGRIII